MKYLRKKSDNKKKTVTKSEQMVSISFTETIYLA